MNEQVTFVITRRADVQTYRCRETGICYQLEPIRSRGCYRVLNSGNLLAVIYDKAEAVSFIEQMARLDFRTAQAESAFKA
jgi:hypothetical protein